MTVEVNERGFRIQSPTAPTQEANLDKPVDAAVAVMGGLIGACLAQSDGASVAQTECAVCVHAAAIPWIGQTIIVEQLQDIRPDNHLILRTFCGFMAVVAIVTAMSLV